ncbi:hypothetical protein Aru02nite_01370 [Actinocatenispora rupis]|uniref:Uncharacterized protein n=1 Tax=Actinocatenispora rupis TaxID=519421 RepID=A0A8J3IUZ0_9ACTN|nr:hypothetical protein Aru02nite_01370 [Actinocatenispora rupis]
MRTVAATVTVAVMIAGGDRSHGAVTASERVAANRAKATRRPDFRYVRGTRVTFRRGTMGERVARRAVRSVRTVAATLVS